MKEIKEWTYTYPNESPVPIREGDQFEISRTGGSGRRVKSQWEITEIRNRVRMNIVGIPNCRIISAKHLSGLYLDEWGSPLAIRRDEILEFDDFIVAHRLRAKIGRSA